MIVLRIILLQVLYIFSLSIIVTGYNLATLEPRHPPATVFKYTERYLRLSTIFKEDTTYPVVGQRYAAKESKKGITNLHYKLIEGPVTVSSGCTPEGAPQIEYDWNARFWDAGVDENKKCALRVPQEGKPWGVRATDTQSYLGQVKRNANTGQAAVDVIGQYPNYNLIANNCIDFVYSVWNKIKAVGHDELRRRQAHIKAQQFLSDVEQQAHYLQARYATVWTPAHALWNFLDEKVIEEDILDIWQQEDFELDEEARHLAWRRATPAPKSSKPASPPPPSAPKKDSDNKKDPAPTITNKRPDDKKMLAMYKGKIPECTPGSRGPTNDPNPICQPFNRGPCNSPDCDGNAQGKCTKDKFKDCGCTSSTSTACSLCGGKSEGNNPGVCTKGNLIGMPCSPG